MITFIPLKEVHFPLLLKWLKSPHVKIGWDQDMHWTMDSIRAKYSAYVQGYKSQDGIRKPLYAYIICIDDQEIGYIQFYNASDFSPEDAISLTELPDSLASLDIFIGEENFVGKNWGSRIIKKFCKEYIDLQFEACLVNPNNANLQAVRAYQKAGFVEVEKVLTSTATWMVRKK
jgi:aminoglycoside 6'-N-acetyltransferase